MICCLYCRGDSRVVFLFVRRRNFTEYTTVKLLNWTRMFHLLSCFPLRRKCAVHQGSRTRFHLRKTTSLSQFKPLKWVSCWYFAQLKELHVSRNLSKFKGWVLPPNWVKRKNTAIFVWSWDENARAKQKPQTNGNREIWLVSISVRCFISQWMKRSKHGLFVFPPKKTLVWRRHCSIGQSCCSMTSKRSIDWFLECSSGMKFFRPVVRLTNQKPRAFEFVR